MLKHCLELTGLTLPNSPNAEEALSILSIPLPPSKVMIEKATDDFLDIGVGKDGSGWVLIRCGALGAYMKSRATEGEWVEAFWAEDVGKVVDVTGAFLRQRRQRT
jgi:hypothetical protein